MIQAGTSSQSQAMPVVRLSQNTLLRLIIQVPESAVSRIHIGAPVDVSVQALGRTFEGKVARFAEKLNLDTRTTEVSGVRVHLTPSEYKVLELLSLRKNSVLTKEMCLNHLYNGLREPEVKIIDVFICKLRKKLAQVSDCGNQIETVWGGGYMLRDTPDLPEKIAA